ncbi:alpha/beta fold hydrolase [Arthrobacter celericrescens]|uniref:alpha/beta fold hydrolase n=1 Tax=Arthrobacter celericrescens TaxID=2320851 RepID=UPI0013C436EA|nr:alpha/beta hydrolase [Arthrobacter celericrescens]
MKEKVQVAISADGTEIVGRVRGEGPPLVLVHGGWGDGEVGYEALVPYLARRFTCYTPSTRGRGLSGDNSDHSVDRLVEDLVAFIDMIGGPVCLVGWSGIEAVLGAAARSDAVAAMAIFEGYIPTVAEQGELAALGAAIDGAAAVAAVGNLADAARAFAPYVVNGTERAALAPDFHERWGRSIPAMLRYFQQNATADGPKAYDGGQLARISVPVLALWGPAPPTPHLWRSPRGISRSTLRMVRSVSWLASGISPPWLHRSSLPGNWPPFLKRSRPWRIVGFPSILGFGRPDGRESRQDWAPDGRIRRLA